MSTAKVKKTLRHRKWQLASEGWTVEALMFACSSKQIKFRTVHDFWSINGCTLHSGNMITIIVRDELPEQEKVLTLAHELGHVCLGDTCASRSREGTRGGWLLVTPDDRKEWLANVWAARLLVKIDVFYECLAKLKVTATDGEDGDLPPEVVHVAAEKLNIPERVVILWWETRDAWFREEPGTWLSHSDHPASLALPPGN